MSILWDLIKQVAARRGQGAAAQSDGSQPKSNSSIKPTQDFPADSEALRQHALLDQWWYYGVELLENVESKGAFPRTLPMLPRRMLRNCDLAGMECLDLGSMEGLIPVLMCRGGASRVVATDASNHCLEKMQAVKHYYGVDFDFREIGLMYDLRQKLAGESFDLINCSGLLYHVVSPMHVLLGCRPLLKRNGLMIVSTNVVLTDRCTMEFNDGGRLQAEVNTFWYMSVKFLDYMLRFLKLRPIDCTFLPHSQIQSSVRYVADVPSGYLSVVCRAVDDELPGPTDQWMASAMRHSWEMNGLTDWSAVRAQRQSTASYKGDQDAHSLRPAGMGIDLHAFATEALRRNLKTEIDDSHYLRLSDWN